MRRSPREKLPATARARSRGAGTGKPVRLPRAPWEWALAGGLILALAVAAGLAVYSAMKDSWQIELQHSFSAAPEIVHRYLARPEKRVAWEPGVIAVAKLTGDQSQSGATRMVYMRSDGRRWHQFEELKSFKAGERLGLRREGPNANRTITVRLTEKKSGGTRLLWREEVRYTDLETSLLALWELRTRRGELHRAFDRLDWLALKEKADGEPAQPPRP